MGRVRSLLQAGRAWAEIAEELNLALDTAGLWSLRLVDRRVKGAQAILEEE